MHLIFAKFSLPVGKPHTCTLHFCTELRESCYVMEFSMYIFNKRTCTFHPVCPSHRRCHAVECYMHWVTSSPTSYNVHVQCTVGGHPFLHSHRVHGTISCCKYSICFVVMSRILVINYCYNYLNHCSIPITGSQPRIHTVNVYWPSNH